MLEDVVSALQVRLNRCSLIRAAAPTGTSFMPPQPAPLVARPGLQEKQRTRGCWNTALWIVALLVAFQTNISPGWAQTSACSGDCNADGEVTVDELITMVDIVLDSAPLSACPAGDANGDNQITVDEVLSAVNADLNGCPMVSRATRLTGELTLPPAGQCENCSITIVDFGVIGLTQNGPPKVIRSLKTDSRGAFDTGDLTEALSDPTNGSVDTNGDGKRTLIVVANVNGSGAQVGGVDSIQTGVISAKDFNPTTQVACVAAVFLTAGTTAPCVVRATCAPSEPACLPTVDPDALDDTRIGRLEHAASFISAGLVLPDDVGRAACAAITCTNGGTTQASEQCVTASFQPVP